jgi:16S rRNA (guanine527-N7)-methyltransferase
MSLQEELSLGIAKLGLDVDAQQQELLLKYVVLLHKWNKVYNLTAIRDPQKMVSHHLLDSLAVLPFLWSGRWLDVGCGAGLPGLVLAIVRPQWSFILLDSNSKKTGFVQQAIIELGLKNVGVYCVRVEDFQSTELFDGITSRAFTELGDFLTATRHLISGSGRWAAMKGWAEKELHNVPSGYRVEEIIPLHVPGLDAARSLVVVSCNGAKQHD